MAIADNKVLLAEVMNLVDDHVTAKASRQLEQQILDVLDGYDIATMIRDSFGHEKVETTRRYCHASQRNTENSYRKYACM